MRKNLILGFVILMFLFMGGFVSAELTTDITSYYKFDGNATDSVGSNDWTVDGATYGLNYGQINGGYNFDATNDLMSQSDKDEFSPSNGDMTFSFWIYTKDTSQRKTLLGKGSSSNYEYLIEVNENKMRIIYFTSAGSEVLNQVGTDTISSNTWNHIAVVINNGTSGSSKIYVNGELDISSSLHTGLMSDGTAQLQLGRWATSANYFNGYIDELGLWSRALNSTEVSELYNSGDGFQYPFESISYGFNIITSNTTSSLNTFNATIWNNTINYSYSTTNGTIKTNSTTSWKTGFYNVLIKSSGYAFWQINDFYWSSSVKNNINATLFSGGVASSDTCTGNFIVSNNCEAIIRGGDTFIVES